jgi:hypothetical protein
MLPPGVPAMDDDTRISAAILRLVAARGTAKSVCPTEAARALAAADPPLAWRGQLPGVHRVARLLAREGRIEILRKGRPVAPEAARGVIRLRLRSPDGAGAGHAGKAGAPGDGAGADAAPADGTQEDGAPPDGAPADGARADGARHGRQGDA